LEDLSLLTPEQVAEALQIKPRTIREWLRNGSLPGVKVGRSLRVRRQDLKRYLQGLPPAGKEGSR